MSKKRQAAPVESVVRREWQFLYHLEEWNEDRFEDKVYTGRTLKEACNKMVKWIKRQESEVTLDYEARAEHITEYTEHADKYPDLTQMDHPIKNYVR